jgi:hypothetical protein
LAEFHEDEAPDDPRLTVAPLRTTADDAGCVRVAGASLAAAATFRMPWPSTNGSPTGPGVVVPSSVPFTVSGE